MGSHATRIPSAEPDDQSYTRPLLPRRRVVGEGSSAETGSSSDRSGMTTRAVANATEENARTSAALDPARAAQAQGEFAGPAVSFTVRDAPFPGSAAGGRCRAQRYTTTPLRSVERAMIV